MERMALVAYASRYGSTAEVAQKVAETLTAGGIPALCKPVETVRRIEGCSAVVVGAPLIMGRLHKNARRFLRANRPALSRVPVALFVSGPIHNDEQEWMGAQQQLNSELARFSWLSPLTRKIVGGKFDPAMLRFPLTLLPSLKKMPASDVRDWEAIRLWASELAARLQPVMEY